MSSRNSVIRPFWACIFLIAGVTAAPAQGDDSLRRKFETEYPAANLRLRHFYSALRISGTEKGDRKIMEWELRGNSERMCSIVSKKDGSSEVIMAEPKLSFMLEKKPGTNRFGVTYLGTPAPHDYEYMVRTIWQQTMAASSPYVVLMASVKDFVSEKNFRYKAAREVDTPGGRAIQIQWENPTQEGLKRLGTFEIAADGSWALLRFDLHFPETKGTNDKIMDVGRHAVMEYQGQRDGIPLIHRMRLWVSGPAGPAPETIFDVLKLEPGPVPNDQMALEAFGVSTSPAPQSAPVAYYLFGLSAISVLIVGVLRYASRRQASADHT